MALQLDPELFEDERQILSNGSELITSGLISSSLGTRVIEVSPSTLGFGRDALGNILIKVGEVPYSLEESFQQVTLGFKSSPKPWLPPKLLSQFNKMKKTPLREKEMTDLIEHIARISVDFYHVKSGKFISIRLDGVIVESADTEIDLLLKIQGKRFDMPVFVWKVGSESFSGWKS